MLGNVLRSKTLWSLTLVLVICGAAYAGGAHCNLAKSVSKMTKMTDDGAVVTLEGSNDTAVEHIKAHLTTHEKGERCSDCPFAMEGVTSKVRLTDKGGEITLTGNSPESVKAVQEWARKPAGACCSKHGSV